MQDRFVAVDVGTTGARAVEVVLAADGGGRRPFGIARRGRQPTPSRVVLRRWGAVELPCGAVVDGEVVDATAVADALRRLWATAGFTTRSVRLTVGSARVIVRTVDLPLLTLEDTRSALRLQLGELVPFAPDETVFDAVTVDEDGDQARVLLAAAHMDVVEPLLEAARRAALRVSGVDATPLALARCLGRSVEGDGSASAVAIVELGATTTEVVVARAGAPLFARTIASAGGAAVTEALGRELGLERDEAERIKRLLPLPLGPEGLRAEAAIGAAVDELAAELDDSLAFHNAQVDAVAVDRVVLAGGASRLAGLADRLSVRLGVPVVVPDPLADLDVSSVVGGPTSLAAAAPQLTLAVALALADVQRDGGLVDLRPDHVRPRRRRRAPLVAGLAATALLLVGGCRYQQREVDVRSSRAAAEAAEEQLTARASPDGLDASVAGSPAQRIAQLQTGVLGVLGDDVDWSAVLGELDGLGGPHGVALGSVQGTASAATPSAGAAGITAAGMTAAATSGTGGGSGGAAGTGVSEAAVATPATLTVTATAPSIDQVAAWIEAVAASDRFTDVWVSSTTRISGQGQVQLTALVTLAGTNAVVRTIAQEVAAG